MDWIITPFQRALDFNGRSRRKEYWLFVLFYVIISAALFATFIAIGGISDTLDLTALGEKLVLPMGGVWFLLFALPMLALSVRRWHDLGYTGWMFVVFAVLGAIPLVGFFASVGNIIWFCMQGTVGANKYGDDPLDAPFQGYIQ